MSRAALLLALLLIAAAAFTCSGCGTKADRLRLVIREARDLLNHPQPGDPVWEHDRFLWFTRADAEAPIASEAKTGD